MARDRNVTRTVNRRPYSALAFGNTADPGASVADVLFAQFLDDDLGCASYLVGDEAAGVAVVVDPPFAIEPLLEEAERRGVTVVKALETHTHADHLSGHGRLALEHGIPVAINPVGRRRSTRSSRSRTALGSSSARSS